MYKDKTGDCWVAWQHPWQINCCSKRNGTFPWTSKWYDHAVRTYGPCTNCLWHSCSIDCATTAARFWPCLSTKTHSTRDSKRPWAVSSSMTLVFAWHTARSWSRRRTRHRPPQEPWDCSSSNLRQEWDHSSFQSCVTKKWMVSVKIPNNDTNDRCRRFGNFYQWLWQMMNSLEIELSQLRIITTEFTVGNACPIDGNTRITASHVQSKYFKKKSKCAAEKRSVAAPVNGVLAFGRSRFLRIASWYPPSVRWYSSKGMSTS